MTKATDYRRAFNERTYARLAITIPKERKSAVEAHAREKGMSVNNLVNTLLREDMKLSEAEWKQPQEE